MVKAWEIARNAVKKFGGKVKEYFAQALKMAWSIVKAPKGAIVVNTEVKTMTKEFPYQCSCCGTPIKHPYFFEGKMYGSTCIGYVSGAVPFISLMNQYGVKSVEEAQRLHAEAMAKVDAENKQRQVIKDTRVAQGKANGEIYDLLVEYVAELEKTGEATSHYKGWIRTLEETTLAEMSELQQDKLATLYENIMKQFKGAKAKKGELRWEFGAKNFGWTESEYDVAIAKVKKMKFSELKELAVKLNIDEAEACEDNRSDKKYLKDSLTDVDMLDRVIEVLN